MGDGMPASLTAPRTGGKAAFHLVQVISGHQIRLAMSLWFVGRLIDQFEAEVIVPLDAHHVIHHSVDQSIVLLELVAPNIKILSPKT